MTRDREVLLLLGLVVAAVLGLNLLTILVPQLDMLFTGAPVLVVGLIVGTGYVMVRTILRPR